MAAIVVQRTIQQAMLDKTRANFWMDKTPCWEMCNCPKMIQEECPTPKYQFLPCWEIEGTYCKLDDYGTSGTDIKICETCQVYKKWGNSEPIHLKLLGKGINTSLKALKKLAKGIFI